jgi:predicted NBD/HSP70 family sugar kinase
MRACIDIGGTKVAVSLAPDAVLRRTGAPPLQARRSEPTAKTGDPFALARQVLRLVDEACAEAGVAPGAITAAGVSSCGPFVLNNGSDRAGRRPTSAAAWPARRAACPTTGTVRRWRRRCTSALPPAD